jgi:hypothetical protein
LLAKPVGFGRQFEAPTEFVVAQGGFEDADELGAAELVEPDGAGRAEHLLEAFTRGGNAGRHFGGEGVDRDRQSFEQGEMGFGAGGEVFGIVAQQSSDEDGRAVGGAALLGFNRKAHGVDGLGQVVGDSENTQVVRDAGDLGDFGAGGEQGMESRGRAGVGGLREDSQDLTPGVVGRVDRAHPPRPGRPLRRGCRRLGPVS